MLADLVELPRLQPGALGGHHDLLNVLVFQEVDESAREIERGDRRAGIGIDFFRKVLMDSGTLGSQDPTAMPTSGECARHTLDLDLATAQMARIIEEQDIHLAPCGSVSRVTARRRTDRPSRL